MHLYHIIFLFSVHLATVSNVFCRICASSYTTQSRHDVCASRFRSDQHCVL